MPSRDHDPTRDDGRPPERWSGEPSRDAMRREAERRSARGSAFGDPDSDEPASGARGGTFTPPEAGRGGSAFGAAREVHSPGQGSSPLTGSAWSRQAERQSARTEAPRGRGRPLESEHRPSWQRGLDREDDTQFDADYRQWRDEQMRLLDRDYAQWRQERYRKFAEEFSQWRNKRLQSHASTNAPRSASAPGQPPPLGDINPLGTPAGTPLRGDEVERERPPEPERSGGLLGSLLGGHSERHKP